MRLTNGTYVNTQPLTVIEDPRNTAAGLTTADLQAQFEHNMRVRDLVSEVNQLVARLRAAQQSLKGKPDSASQLDAIDSEAAHLVTPTIRYSKPELQTHITMERYPAGHMMYIEPGSLLKLKKDLSRFVRASVPG